MWTPDYFVRYVDFPARVEGAVVPNTDGSFDIYINSGLSEADRARCLEHELRHIRRDHLYSGRPVENLELEADGLSSPHPFFTVFNLPTSTHIPLFPSLPALKAYLDLISQSLPPPAR